MATSNNAAVSSPNTTESLAPSDSSAPAKKKTGRKRGTTVERKALPPVLSSRTFRVNNCNVIFSIHEPHKGHFGFSRKTERIDGSVPKPDFTEVPLSCLADLARLLRNPELGNIHRMNKYSMFSAVTGPDGQPTTVAGPVESFWVVVNPVRETKFKDSEKIPMFRAPGTVIDFYIPSKEVADFLAQACEEAQHDRVLPPGAADEIAALKAESESDDALDAQVEVEETELDEVDEDQAA